MTTAPRPTCKVCGLPIGETWVVFNGDECHPYCISFTGKIEPLITPMPSSPALTHHAECWRVHHACAVGRLERVLAVASGSYTLGDALDAKKAPLAAAMEEILAIIGGEE